MTKSQIPNAVNRNKKQAAASIVAPSSGQALESTQIGKFSTKGGTGFAAEDANAFHDERAGRTVERTGLDNAKNGADRVVDGVSIQTKYFDSASKSVNAAFDSESKMYRYGDMQLEVPKDQYEEAVKLMREKIAQGKVPGVTDPDEATKLVRQGNTTYEQARNIARAGNIDSLKYDARNGAVVCAAAFGVSFAIEFGAGIWRGDSATASLKNASLQGIKTSGLAFFTSVGSAQLLRTQAARAGTVIARTGVKKVAQTKLGKTAIQKIAQASLGKTVSGAAAINHVSKLLRSNVITGAVTVSVMTLPDLYKASISGSISWKQLAKNLVVNTASIAAGTGGWLAGMAAGVSIGSFVPVVGTGAGGITGAIIGAVLSGWAGSAGTKLVMDEFIEDDSVQLQLLMGQELTNIAEVHLLNQKEFERFLDFVSDMVSSSFLGALHASSDRRARIREAFAPYALEIAKSRTLAKLPTDTKVIEFLNNILEKADAGCLLPETETRDDIETEYTDEKLVSAISTEENTALDTLVEQRKRAKLNKAKAAYIKKLVS